MQKKILVAENNSMYLRALVRALKLYGFQHIAQATDADTAIKTLNEDGADVAIIDLRLEDNQDSEDFSGIKVMEETPAHIPKILYTAYPSFEAAKKVLGPRYDSLQRLGVDIVSKDAGVEALIESIRYALNQSALRLDAANKAIMVEGREVALTPQEYKFMELMFKHPNEVLSRRIIVEHGLGEDYQDYSDDSRVDNIVSQLREKMGDDADEPRYLQTVRGHGLRLAVFQDEQ